MRLLVFNLATDADHPVLSFTTQWLNALAQHYTAIDVVTMQAGRLTTAANVRVFSVGRERGSSEALRAARFYAILSRLLRQQPYSACFAHMMPLFAVMGAPLLSLYHVPTVLWYTHKQDSRILRLAAQVSWRIVTAVPTSFPFATPKLRPLGHGIDIDFYAPADLPRDQPATLVQVARLSPIKHQATLIRASAALDAQVILIGDAQHSGDSTYRQHLETLAGAPRRHAVVFHGSASAEQVRAVYQRATIAVNLSPVGLFDKAALEAMACGVPTIVSNPAFDSVLGRYAATLRIAAPDDTDGLTAQLQTLLAYTTVERDAMAQTLRAGVLRDHSLPTLISRLVNVLHTGEPN